MAVINNMLFNNSRIKFDLKYSWNKIVLNCNFKDRINFMNKINFTEKAIINRDDMK